MENTETTLDDALIHEEHHPPIYSKGAIKGFAFFFSTIFGAVLLVQNLRDIQKYKEARHVLILSIAYTVISIIITVSMETTVSSLTYFINLVGGLLLVELFYKTHFPNDADIPKKKIWKPLIISLAITVSFILGLLFWASYL
jgi:purine-cytosine permease-like protein